MLDIKCKVGLITGGASGIGLAFAEELLRNGCTGVSIVDVNEQKGVVEKDNLNKKYGNGKVIFVKANVVNKTELDEAFKKTIETFKHLDIVFNNAGLLHEKNYEICLDVNVKGAMHCLKLALDKYLPKYKSDQEAVIINTGSVAGLVPYRGIEMYSTTKFAIVGLTLNFGVDFHYKRTGVRVIAICPDGTSTAFSHDIALKFSSEEAATAFLNEVPTREVQTPEEVAQICMKLVREADNGSLWSISVGKETKIEFPTLVNI